MLYKYLYLLWAIAIAIGSFMPAKKLPKVAILEFDKIVHILMYFMLTFFLAKAQIFNNKNLTTTCLAVTIFYGIFIEIIQGTVPFINRSFDIFDIIANTTGAIIALFFYKHLNKK